MFNALHGHGSAKPDLFCLSIEVWLTFKSQINAGVPTTRVLVSLHNKFILFGIPALIFRSEPLSWQL